MSLNDEPPKKKWVKELRDILITVILAVVIMLVLNRYVFNLSVVKGQSMQPTLADNERLFIDKIVYYFTSPKHGEVVVLQDPDQNTSGKSYLVKRIIAVPGDRVEIRNHRLFVNDEIQNESYTDVQIEDADVSVITLQEDEFFVMGDNRHAGKSKDSRYFGSVSRQAIVGRAEFIFWPIYTIRGL